MKKTSVLMCMLLLVACQDKTVIAEQTAIKPSAQPTVAETLKAVDNNLAHATKKEAVSFKAIPIEFKMPASVTTICKENASFGQNEIACPAIDVKIADVEPIWIERALNLEITGDNNPDMLKFRRELKEFAEEQLSDESGPAYAWTIEPSFLGMREQVAQFSVVDDVFTGGAHGMYTINYYLYDLDLGSRIKLTDIQLPMAEQSGTGLHELAQRAYREFLAKEGQMSVQEIREHEEFYPFELSDNFYFNDKGLVLSYNPYHLGPYAMGVVEIVIGYNKLANVLRAEYLPIEVLKDVSKNITAQ